MNSSDNKGPAGIIFTDFDGTLYSGGRIAEPNWDALKRAGDLGYLRVIATGRSLYGFRRAASRLGRDICGYADYMIFSSGAATMRLEAGCLDAESHCAGAAQPLLLPDSQFLENNVLEAAEAAGAASLFYRHGIDFMIQMRVPQNHFFTYVKAGGGINPDFYRRINIYEGFAEPLRPADGEDDADAIARCCAGGISQLVAVVPPTATGDNEKYAAELIDYLRVRLSDCTVIRATSPLDGRSLWVEIFNSDVSKSQAASRFARRFALNAGNCLAVGNDFNDEDMLEWAGTARTVDGAPARLRERFSSAGAADDGAVARAIAEFIAETPED